MKRNLTDSNWSENGTPFIKDNNVENAWNIIKEKFAELRNAFVPIQSGGKKTWKDKSSVPIDKKMQSIIRKKHKLHQRWIRSCNDESRLEYVKAR